MPPRVSNPAPTPLTDEETLRRMRRKERLGHFIYHPTTTTVVAVLIVVSVLLTIEHLHLEKDDPLQRPLLLVDLIVTVLFILELSIKAYVAQSWRRFFAQYWIDLIAVIPWFQSLRVLRILRLLRVFSVALIVSRRIRAVSSIMRSAIGEYLLLAAILCTLFGIGTYTLYLSEHAQRAVDGPDANPDDDLDDLGNAAWATVFFIVANEPMIGAPKSTLGKGVALTVMFGGLTTFAVFTGVVSALMVGRLRRRTEIDDMDRFHLTDHIVLCGWNHRAPLILEELGFARATEIPAVVVVAELEELPPEVTKLPIGPRVFLVRGDATTPSVLEQARVAFARRAIIVADSTRPRADQDRDARTVLAALMVERMNPKITTCAELLNRENEVHLRVAGVEEVVTTPEAGGQQLAMAALYPGLGDVVSELISAKSGATLAKEPASDDVVALTVAAAMEKLKRDRNVILVGLEVNGREGKKSPVCKMLVNPPASTLIGPRDNLVLIVATGRT
jgi:voltage-gated potassium channel